MGADFPSQPFECHLAWLMIWARRVLIDDKSVLNATHHSTGGIFWLQESFYVFNLGRSGEKERQINAQIWFSLCVGQGHNALFTRGGTDVTLFCAIRTHKGHLGHAKQENTNFVTWRNTGDDDERKRRCIEPGNSIGYWGEITNWYPLLLWCTH